MDPLCTRLLAENWYGRLAPTGSATAAAEPIILALESMVDRLADAVTTEPLALQAAIDVGAELVTLDFTDPVAIRHTGAMIDDLMQRSPAHGVPIPDARQRLVELVGAVGTGYAQALRSRTLDGQELLRRAMSVAQANTWQMLRDIDLRLRLVFDHAAVAICVCDPDGLVIDVNPALTTMFGRDVDDVRGTAIGDSIHVDDRDRFESQYRELVAAGSGRATLEARYLRADREHGWAAWTLTSVPASTSSPAYVLSIGEDITERRAVNHQLRRLALHDHLTGLPNRAQLIDHLASALNSGDTPMISAVLYCDLNGFKQINDTYGHSFGDTVLRTVAVRLRRGIAPTDLLARIGGDEFVVTLATPASDRRTRDLIDHLQDTLASPVITPRGGPLHLCISIGCTRISNNDERSIEAILHDADIDMYRRRREIAAEDRSA